MVPTYIHVTLRRPRGRIARNPLISKISTFFFFFSITYIVFFFWPYVNAPRRLWSSSRWYFIHAHINVTH